MGNCKRTQHVKNNMDKSDLTYIVELLTEAMQDENWDTILEAKEFLLEYLSDDGSPIELEE